MNIKSVNPFTEEVIAIYELHTENEIEKIITQINSDWKTWKITGFPERKQLMLNLAEILKKRKTTLAEIITSEMGKPLMQSEAEILKCAWVCEYYAENAEKFLSVETIETDASDSYVRFDPLGIILAVMPWNFPFWQVFRFAAPAIMAGNAAVLKHASNVPGCALAIEKLFRDAGFPGNIFRTLLINSTEVERVIENPMVKAVTLTGSEPAGRKVAEICGKNLKKCVLELGGSDPFIVLSDADIADAVNSAVTGRILNNGQSCIAAKRFIIEKPVADIFIREFSAKMENLSVGDPMKRETDIGPLARKDLVEELNFQIESSIKMGAVKSTREIALPEKGFFFSPSVLTNLTPEMPACSQELFGPVASVIVAENREEALKFANATEFGLGASIWTSYKINAEKLLPFIDSGAVFVNGIVKSDPRLPFGGVKNSGFGRELSVQGIREFVNIKTIWIK